MPFKQAPSEDVRRLDDLHERLDRLCEQIETARIMFAERRKLADRRATSREFLDRRVA